MVFDKFKRSLILFAYSHHFEMQTMKYDKLLRAFTAFELKTSATRMSVDAVQASYGTVLARHSLGAHSIQLSVIVSILLSFSFLFS